MRPRSHPGQSPLHQRHWNGHRPPRQKAGWRGGGDDDDCQNLSDTAPLPRTTAAVSPNGQDEASGHSPERGENRQEYLQAHIQTWEEKSRLSHLRRTPKKTDRTSPGGEKNDQGKENDLEDASSSLYRSYRWTSDGDACSSRGGRRLPKPERYCSAPADDRGRQPKWPGRGERSLAGAGRESPGVPPGAHPNMGGEVSAQSSSEDSEEDR